VKCESSDRRKFSSLTERQENLGKSESLLTKVIVAVFVVGFVVVYGRI
jgi:hypothetical protein